MDSLTHVHNTQGGVILVSERYGGRVFIVVGGCCRLLVRRGTRYTNGTRRSEDRGPCQFESVGVRQFYICPSPWDIGYGSGSLRVGSGGRGRLPGAPDAGIAPWGPGRGWRKAGLGCRDVSVREIGPRRGRFRRVYPNT